MRPVRTCPPILACAIAITAATAAGAAFDLKNWSWKRPIESPATQGFARIDVPTDIFAASQDSLDDLRVLDASGALVPHMVVWGAAPGQKSREEKAASIINATFEREQWARATLDFAQPVEKNQIRVKMSGENYRRRAAVEGSADSVAWETLADDLYLFDISQPGATFRADTLSFPNNNFRYLRLTVNNMSEDPKRIAIESVSAWLARDCWGTRPTFS